MKLKIKESKEVMEQGLGRGRRDAQVEGVNLEPWTLIHCWRAKE